MSKNKRVLSRIEKELKRRNKQRYSRSISATNQLFTPNYLTSRPSRRRVFDPNAEYYKAGGMTDDKSMMGYRDDSQYRNEPYIDINTPNGQIDMSETGIPLLANGVYLPPYSGVHQFDTNVVREIPLAKEGMTVAAPKIDRVKGTNINGKIQCPPGYTYNPQTRWCERTVCPSGYTLDEASGKCISISTRQKFVMPEREVPVLTDELKTKMTQERFRGFSRDKKKSKISLENLNPKWDARYNTWVQEDPNNPGKMLRFRDERGTNNSWEPFDDKYKESYDKIYTPEGTKRPEFLDTNFLTYDEDKGEYVRDELSQEALAATWGDRPPLRSVLRGLYKESDHHQGWDHRRGPNLGTTTLRKDYISQHPELMKYFPKGVTHSVKTGKKIKSDEGDWYEDEYADVPYTADTLDDETQIVFQDNPFFGQQKWGYTANRENIATAESPLKTRSAFPTVYGFKTKDGKVVELAGTLPMYLEEIPVPKWKPKVDPKRAGEYDKKTKTYYVKDKSDPIYLDWAARTEEAKLVKENKKNMLSYLRETYNDPDLEFITIPGTLHQTVSYDPYDYGSRSPRESYQDDQDLNALYKDLTGIGSQEEYIKLLEEDPLYFQKLNPGLSPEEAQQAFAKKFDNYQKQRIGVPSDEVDESGVFVTEQCDECKKMHSGFGYKEGDLVYSTTDPIGEVSYGKLGAKMEYEKDETDPDIERIRPDYITRDAGAPKKPNPPGFHPFIDFGDRKQWLKKPKLTLPDKKQWRQFGRSLKRNIMERPGSGKRGLFNKRTRINWPTAGGSPDAFGIHGTGGGHALDLFDVEYVPLFDSKRLNRGYTRDELARIHQANQRALETGEELDFSDIPLGGIRGLRDRIAYKKKYRDYKKQLPQYEEDLAEYEENKRLKELELAEQQRKDDAFRAGIPYVPLETKEPDSDDELKAELEENVNYETGGSIDMDLTPEEVEEYKKQGFIVEDLSGPRAEEEVEEDYHAGMNAMMKARLAYEYMHGNPAATRLVAPTDNPYIFPSGAYGTHFMSSYDNYAIPEIQSVNGVLKMTGPRNEEAIRFDRPEDADYFAADNYKRISPAFIESELSDKEIQELRDRGYILEELPSYQPGGPTPAPGRAAAVQGLINLSKFTDSKEKKKPTYQGFLPQGETNKQVAIDSGVKFEKVAKHKNRKPVLLSKEEKHNLSLPTIPIMQRKTTTSRIDPAEEGSAYDAVMSPADWVSAKTSGEPFYKHEEFRPSLDESGNPIIRLGADAYDQLSPGWKFAAEMGQYAVPYYGQAKMAHDFVKYTPDALKAFIDNPSVGNVANLALMGSMGILPFKQLKKFTSSNINPVNRMKQATTQNLANKAVKDVGSHIEAYNQLVFENQVAKFRRPDLQLKSTMPGSPLEKQLSKTGEINVKNIQAHINRADVSKQDKIMLQKVLDEKFSGQTKINYEDFKTAMSEELVNLNHTFGDAVGGEKMLTEWGVNPLGYDLHHEYHIKNFNREIANRNLVLDAYKDKFKNKSISRKEYNREKRRQENKIKYYEDQIEKAKQNTVLENYPVTYSSAENFGKGSADHWGDPNTLGHSRVMITNENPEVIHFLETQSDWVQKSGKTRPIDKARIERRLQMKKENVSNNRRLYEQHKEAYEKGLKYQGDEVQKWELEDMKERLNASIKDLESYKGTVKNPVQKNLLKGSIQERLLQENMTHAVEQGKTIMRYPTSDTAIKIQGYPSDIINTERIQTILRKYKNTPKMIKKTIGVDVKIVTDGNENTWYEWVIPKKFIKGEMPIKAFKKGGSVNYELGDVVDEAAMERLKKLGYTLKEI